MPGNTIRFSSKMKHICDSKIAILMATYNGAKYLKEQMDSLLAQTFCDWHLYIHDDGSTDRTIQILTEYHEKYLDKITLLDYPSQGGPCLNFMSMLTRIDAEYYMFCDQDDVWLPEKIEISHNEMMIREQESPEIGIVICSDLFVVDEDLTITGSSMWNYLRVCPQYIKTFRDCGASAVVTGCTMIFNQKAKEYSLPCSPLAIMHDSWICLSTLKHRGKLYGIPKQLVFYRQHHNNCLGVGISASQLGVSYRIRNFSKVYKDNVAYYKMLSALGYGSIFKYILSKVMYKLRMRRGYY